MWTAFSFGQTQKNVLKYIKNDNKHFPVFVTHRVTEIKDNSNKSEWHYVPSKFNIADVSTLPMKFEEFHNKSRYVNSPKFLRCFELPKFSCTEDGFPVNLNNINFESKNLKEDKVSQKRTPFLF